MERIKCLNLYQKGILLFMTAMILVFAPVYHMTVSRVGFEYKDKIFVPDQKDGSTVYSGSIKGQRAQFTVSEDKTVVFQYGSKTYGPYTVREDETAIPKDEENAGQMTGVELREGDDILFRGGVLEAGGHKLMYNEDGTIENLGFSYTTSDGKEMDADGNVIDPMEPSVYTILDLMGSPDFIHKGEWLAWFGGVIICVLNALSMLFADELFRLNLSFRIRNADDAEPSDWEMTGRYIGWTVVPVMAFVVFIMGLQ